MRGTFTGWYKQTNGRVKLNGFDWVQQYVLLRWEKSPRFLNFYCPNLKFPLISPTICTDRRVGIGLGLLATINIDM